MKRVVIFEDSADICDIYEIVFSPEFKVRCVFETDTYKDTKLMEQYIQESDIVISDYDGVPFDLIKVLANKNKKPLLLVSGSTDVHRQGVPFVEKPCNLEELLKKVFKMI